MCGIAGYISRGYSNRELMAQALKRMTAAQAHRGPDDSGIYITPDGRAGLGNRRLAIIDLSSAGHMPIGNADGSVWITYNGEVYNFVELRAELERLGYVFRSRTDSEVVLHAYEAWGPACVHRLRGMFAFAILDLRGARQGSIAPAPQLFLARDRLGIKPLYYHWDGRRLVFASELRALLASGLVEFRLDPSALLGYLELGAVPGEGTILAGVRSLPPASTLTLDGHGLRIESYWSPAAAGGGEPGPEPEEVLRAALEEAVRIRLVSDVPLGAFLSGGVDSSAVVALMRRATNGTVRTFSILFPEQEFNEGVYARQVARQYATDHHEVELSGQDVVAEMDQVIAAMDQPSVDGVNTYFVSKFARESGIIVALSGLGGDELFGGYPSFRLVRRLAWLGRVPGAGRALASVLGRLDGPSGARKLALLRSQAGGVPSAYVAVRAVRSPWEAASLLAADVRSQATFEPVDYAAAFLPDGADTAWQVTCLELRTYTHNQLLRDTDAMSMAHSLEVRVPLLDHQLVELASRLPASLRDGRGQPKWLLVQTALPEMGPDFFARPKRGFTFPFARWLRCELRDWVEEALAPSGGPMDGLLDPDAALAEWRAFLAGRAHWARPWSLAVLNRWAQARAALFKSSP